MKVSVKQARIRRGARALHKIKQQGVEQGRYRLHIHRSNQHIYAQLFEPVGGRVIASASTVEKAAAQIEGDKKTQAAWVGTQIAERAREAGIAVQVACDRAGFKYHGRVKALVEAARESGMLI